MNPPINRSIRIKFLLLPALALALGVGAAVLLISQAQTARADAPDGAQASVQAEAQTAALLTDASSFDLGSSHTCALTAEGLLKC